MSGADPDLRREDICQSYFGSQPVLNRPHVSDGIIDLPDQIAVYHHILFVFRKIFSFAQLIGLQSAIVTVDSLNGIGPFPV